MSDPKENELPSAAEAAANEMPATGDSAVDENSELAADPAAHDDVELGDSLIDIEPEEKGDPYGGHEPQTLKRILEAALFASGAIMSVSHLRDLFDKNERPHGRVIRQCLAELIANYQGQGVQLVEVASGYRFQTDADTAPWIARLWDEKPQKYSRALMETIALIAYRQPITRGEIEDVRGVAVSSNIIRTLLERDWVRVVGHRDVPGRPAMYATTRQFLDYFGLHSLDQLPHLSEIRDLDELNPQMQLSDTEGEGGSEDVAAQSELSFSDMIDKLRESEQSGKTGSEYLDEQLDDELAAMDEVNSSFEQAMAQQRAEHEHPDLNLDEDEVAEPDADEPTAVRSAADSNAPAGVAAGVEATEPAAEPDEMAARLSEQEQWKIIQEKLAQQQALLDARESDPPREDTDDE